jgi:tetratricopeptide (TPR) repeat protein
MIAGEHGNIARAAQLVAQATQLDARRADWLAQLGRLRLAQQDLQAALAAARCAVALHPDDAATLDTLGVVLSRAGAHDEAVAPFRQAVARDPRPPLYWYNLGAAEQFVGRIAEAAVAYRQALQLDPGFFKALSALSEMDTVALTAAENLAIEAALARDDLTPDDELRLCHAQARVHERARRPADAMLALARGKRRKRASLDRPPEEDEALFDAVMRTCTPAFCQAQDGFDSTEPVFIVGMPRSGTTLVERIVSSHPDVTSAGELMNFSLVVKRAAATPSNRVLDAATIEAAATLDFAGVGRAYLESTRPHTGGTLHFIDKMPLNFLYAGLIHRALPRARIICVKRGAADTCLGNYRQLFATGFSYYDYAYDLGDTARYVAGFDRLTKYWCQVLGGAWLEVRYEDVVTDLEVQARRLLAFCGLTWDPACLDFQHNPSPVATASSVQVRSPIYATSIGRWQQYRPHLDPALTVLAELGVPLA